MPSLDDIDPEDIPEIDDVLLDIEDCKDIFDQGYQYEMPFGDRSE